MAIHGNLDRPLLPRPDEGREWMLWQAPAFCGGDLLGGEPQGMGVEGVEPRDPRDLLVRGLGGSGARKAPRIAQD